MIKNTQFLVVDTETGGFDPEKNSILSIAGVIWEPRTKIKKVFDIYIKDDQGSIEDAALKVNKIDLNVVKEQGLTPVESVKHIRTGLNACFGPHRRPIQLVGHNVAFDIGFIRRLYMLANEEFSQDFRERAIDTCSILQFLIISGKIKSERASADVLFESAGVFIPEEERHTAMGDALATAFSIDKFLDKF